MFVGYVLNNSGRPRHIFKRRVPPGQKVEFSDIYSLYGDKVPSSAEFVNWLRSSILPPGWEIVIVEEIADVADVEEIPVKAENGMYREVLEAAPIVSSNKERGTTTVNKTEVDTFDPEGPSLEYATPARVDKLTARDIYNLRIKDNPKRIIGMINSIYKLRRALTLCNQDGRKDMISKMIRKRVKDLQNAGGSL